MQMVQFPTQTSQQKGGEIISCCNRLWKFWLLLPQGCVDGLIGPVTWSQNGESTHAHGIRMQMFGSFLSGMVKGQLKATPEFQEGRRFRAVALPFSARLSQLLALRKLKPRMRPQWTGCQPQKQGCHTSTRVRFSLGVSDAGLKLKYHTSVTQWACWLIFNPIKTLWAVRKANDQKIGIQWWYNA